VSAALRTGQPSVCYRAIVVLPLLLSGDRAATERLAREPPAGASESISAARQSRSERRVVTQRG
jgi:hypothetical protein